MKDNLKNKILDSIERGEVKMRPKWHFILKSALFALGGIIVVLALLYVSSFIIFSLHKSGLWFVPAFGPEATRDFFLSLPWLLIGAMVIFIALLEILVRKFSFGYRKPFLYTAVGLILFTVVGGFALASTPLHSLISDSMYKKLGPSMPKKVVVCSVATTTDEGFKCKDDEDEAVDISVTSDTRLPLGTNFAPGDKVVIFGEKLERKISAKGIRGIGEKHFKEPKTKRLHPKLK